MEASDRRPRSMIEMPIVSEDALVNIDLSPVEISADATSAFQLQAQQQTPLFVPVPTTPSAIYSTEVPISDPESNVTKPIDLPPVQSESEQYQILKNLFNALPAEQRLEWQKRKNLKLSEGSSLGTELPDNLEAWPDKETDFLNWYAKVVAYAMVEKERSESCDRQMIDLYRNNYTREIELMKENYTRELAFVKDQIRTTNERDEQLERFKSSQEREITALKAKLKEKDLRIAELEKLRKRKMSF